MILNIMAGIGLADVTSQVEDPPLDAGELELAADRFGGHMRHALNPVEVAWIRLDPVRGHGWFGWLE